MLPPALKLGVILKEADGRIKIEEVRTGSVAEKAGLKEGDILISMDDWKIDKIEDARIFLVDKKEGETVKIKIVRNKFLFGEKEIEITATF